MVEIIQLLVVKASLKGRVNPSTCTRARLEKVRLDGRCNLVSPVE